MLARNEYNRRLKAVCELILSEGAEATESKDIILSSEAKARSKDKRRYYEFG
jgi:hypothetical protein